MNSSPDRPVTRRGASSSRPPAGVWIIAAVALVPIVSLFVLAAGDSAGVWTHLISTVLPSAIWTTFKLMAGVGALSAAIGIGAAWLVSRYQFAGRNLLHWALVLPLAIPTYISAYCFVELLDYSGPVESLLRAVFGGRGAYLPDVRSTGGAVFVMSIVLYPYVYLACRLVFELQGARMIEVGRVLGSSGLGLFFRVALPLARPAVAAGVALALMETLNDIGAVEMLGVRTLTFSVFDVWLNRSSLAGAAQVACMMLAVVAMLLFLELHSRGARGYAVRHGGAATLTRVRISGLRGGAAALACALPPLIGFATPLALLIHFAVKRMDQLGEPALARAAVNSLAVSLATAAITVVIGLVLVTLAQRRRSLAARYLTRLATLGYAVPGSVLAIGTLYAITAFDNGIDGFLRANFGVSSGLLLSGSAAIIVYAASVRFLAVAHAAIESGYSRLSGHVVLAARTLGRTANQTLFAVELPLMRRALATAGLLVFVDTMKELSATVLLRPFNFSTLATHVYEFASRARFEDASVAALAIVVIGTAPVVLLSRMQDGRMQDGRRQDEEMAGKKKERVLDPL